MNLRTLILENQHILYDADVLSEIDTGLFEPDELQARGLLTGSAPGRGTTWFYVHNEVALVLRHYRRGGWAAPLLKDCYLWSGLERTRAWREFQLLAHMHRRELPVPQPIAARVIQHGRWFTADLITHRIMFTQSLAETLRTRGLDAHRWVGIGLTLRRFHDAGIYHADLNAHNILLGKENTVYLADFDKGELRKSAPRWQQANLARLLRSLRKLKKLNPELCFSEADWGLLTDGYRK